MKINLEPYFREYEALAAAADEVFRKVREQYADCVTCHTGCADCCYALFDLTLIEALYINRRFREHFPEKGCADLLEKANRADRKTYKLKREAYKDLRDGRRNEEQILRDMAAHKVRCPLLNDRDLCDLYDFRPITCRFYGIPTAINGRAHTCGLSRFKPGEPYPTVHLEKIQKRLYDLSARLVGDIGSRYPKLSELLVPLSMALLTRYDDAYLGIGAESGAEERDE